jgi:hypothetical protein
MSPAELAKAKDAAVQQAKLAREAQHAANVSAAQKKHAANVLAAQKKHAAKAKGAAAKRAAAAKVVAAQQAVIDAQMASAAARQKQQDAAAAQASMAQQSNSNYGRTIYDKGPGSWGLDYGKNRSTGVSTIIGGTDDDQDGKDAAVNQAKLAAAGLTLEDYLADKAWHGPNYGKVKTGLGSADFLGWYVQQIAKQAQTTPTFNTTMFDDIWTDQTVSPIDTLALKQAYVGPGERKSRDEEAAANVDTFVDIPVAKPTKPAKKTTKPTKTKVSVGDELAAIVREIQHRNDLRDQVMQDLMAARDKGIPSPMEVQAAINAMMGNEFGGVGGQAGMEAALGRANIETNRSGGWDSQVG